MACGIAMFGGAFDPVHVGHLRCALEVRETLQLKAVHLIPTARPPHRAMPSASADRRFAMVRLAVQGVAGLIADPRELERAAAAPQRPSYSVESVAELRAHYGADEPLVLVVGQDALDGFTGWHRWQDILGMAHLLVLERPGHAGRVPPELASVVAPLSALQDTSAGLLARLGQQPLDISSTDLRRRLCAGRSVRFLVPDPVHQYIATHRLYAAGLQTGAIASSALRSLQSAGDSCTWKH